MDHNNMLNQVIITESTITKQQQALNVMSCFISY